MARDLCRSRLVLVLFAVLGCGGNSPSEDSSVGGTGAGALGGGGSTATAGGTALGGGGETPPTAGAGANAGSVSGGSGGMTSGFGASGGPNPSTSGGSSASGASSGRGGAAGTGGALTSGSSAGGSAGSAGSASGGAGGVATGKCGPVTPVPESVRTRLNLDPFYQKHVDANGVPVLASDEPADESLILACELLNNMLSQRDDVRAELIRRKARFAIIGKNEGTAEIPEYGYRGRPQAEIDSINERARGLGGQVASCGEENILCLAGDRYRRESICVHEFAHTITTYGAYTADRSFERDLQAAYDSASASGILDRTYRKENLQEYWAEGVQDWYGTNDFANPPNGIHNQVNTRSELAEFDPTLHALVASIFPEATAWGDCHLDP